MGRRRRLAKEGVTDPITLASSSARLRRGRIFAHQLADADVGQGLGTLAGEARQASPVRVGAALPGRSLCSAATPVY